MKKYILGTGISLCLLMSSCLNDFSNDLVTELCQSRHFSILYSTRL